jgi:uncharacterized OsmC-like protein
METVLASFAGCTSFDVMTILKKKRQNVSGYSVETEAEMSEEIQQRFGVQLDKDQLKALVR